MTFKTKTKRLEQGARAGPAGRWSYAHLPIVPRTWSDSLCLMTQTLRCPVSGLSIYLYGTSYPVSVEFRNVSLGKKKTALRISIKQRHRWYESVKWICSVESLILHDHYSTTMPGRKSVHSSLHFFTWGQFCMRERKY